MGAVYVPPTTGTTYPIFRTGTHADQLGANDSPDNNQGFFSSSAWHAPDSANLYVVTTANNITGVTIFTHIQQADRLYNGTDARSHKGGIYSHVDVDNNDAAYAGGSGVSYNMTCVTRVGVNGPSYGTCHGLSSAMHVYNQGSANNEYSPHFMIMTAGTYDQHLTIGGDFWFTDWALHGPIGTQPGLLGGISLITNNFNNGSPSLGPSYGMSLQSLFPAGGGFETHCQGEVPGGTPATTYPMDIGYHVSGVATGGTGDAFTNAVQVGGRSSAWSSPGPWAGDQGQVGRGVVVKAKNAGTSCARLGAFVSEGIGEAGGTIYGLDANDTNRVSTYRSANGVMNILGQIIPVSLVSAANDGAAATAGVPVGGLYQTSGTLKVRLS